VQNSLHITNGDGAANIIKATVLPGTVLPWRDPMHHGPFPSARSLDEQSGIRIRYLDPDDQAQNDDQASRPTANSHGFSERDALLARSSEFDEVVLWFEHDLLDQLQLLQLLDWFANHGHSGLALSLICIDSYTGVPNFRGIGQLTTAQMASLYPQRQSVTQVQFETAVKFWQAFCDSDPRALLNLCRLGAEDTSQLPFLLPAIKRHLQEYPWTGDGLTRTERQILRLIDSGVVSPQNVFVRNMDLESCLFVGDWRSYSHINDLCVAKQPLLSCKPGTFMYPPVSEYSEQFRKQTHIIVTAG